MVKAFETVIIKKITGNERGCQHLSESGFVLNEEITVANEIDGDLILKDSCIAIGMNMANHILA